MSAAPAPETGAINAALDALARRQHLNRLTRAVHAAAWSDTRGRLLAVYEDVGRHNALDKLIGWRASQADPAEGFCLITSRCSYEMVSKAAAADMALLVAVSSPTGLALDTAAAAGMTVVARARADGNNVFGV